MPTWTEQQYADFIRRQAKHNDYRIPSGPKLEPPFLNWLHPAVARAPENRRRFSIRIESRRVRLCDPDNLCGKFFVDCLRHSGIITDDTAAIVDYSICQKKVATKKEERTEITVSLIQS